MLALYRRKELEMKSFKAYIVAMAAIFICLPAALAETNVVLPDLVVESVDFHPAPKENGIIESAEISVINKGAGGAQECILALDCEVIKCYMGRQCDMVSHLVNGNLFVPALKSGEKVKLQWKPSSPINWAPGKYSVVAEIDRYNAVQESNESNNIQRSSIYIGSLSPRAAPVEK